MFEEVCLPAAGKSAIRRPSKAVQLGLQSLAFIYRHHIYRHRKVERPTRRCRVTERAAVHAGSRCGATRRGALSAPPHSPQHFSAFLRSDPHPRTRGTDLPGLHLARRLAKKVRSRDKKMTKA